MQNNDPQSHDEAPDQGAPGESPTNELTSLQARVAACIAIWNRLAVSPTRNC